MYGAMWTEMVRICKEKGNIMCWKNILVIIKHSAYQNGTFCTVNDLLGCPRTILVDTDRSQKWCNSFKHCKARCFAASFKKFLDHSVANVIYNAVCELFHMVIWKYTNKHRRTITKFHNLLHALSSHCFNVLQTLLSIIQLLSHLTESQHFKLPV